LRHAYFGPARGWCDTAIINRSDLREPSAGPCIIEEYDSTCVVPPGSPADLDPFRESRYRCACDPALNLALIPKIKREGPRDAMGRAARLPTRESRGKVAGR